ncbi:MAG TPA: hypothetical protein VNZ58_08590 [Thermomicrobiales bacterium]|nr:hypothetical protein [Thermomicrobiales bacterium]
MWLMLASLLAAFGGIGAVFAQDMAQANRLPVVMIDALEQAQWSLDQVVAAPGQRIAVTNRDVSPHTFTVDAWNIDVDLPTLIPVEITVPDDAEPGAAVPFVSTANDDRERGMSGTIFVVTRDQVLAAARQQRTVSVAVANRTTIRIDDAFTFSPEVAHLAPGSLLEIENSGSIEHHFVVDEWQINETIAPGDVALIQVPSSARPGDIVEFYCSVPGHKELGMIGMLEIDAPAAGASAQSPAGPGRAATVSVSLGAFLPDPSLLGDQWSRVRSGPADTIVSSRLQFNSKVFPGEGIGAAYVGPAGSRVTVVVMPLSTDAVPSDQVKDAIREVQTAMVQSWTTDALSAAAMQRIPPPKGCDMAQRVTGIVPVTTLPAGGTVCQIRAAGVAIFVAVEGEIYGMSGVDAADTLLSRLLSGRDIVEPGS